MKTLLALSLLMIAGLAHANTKIEGLSQSNAGIITEALLAKANTDSSILVDKSVYTVTKVTKVDEQGSGAVQCTRHHFGGTPAQYSCEIKELND